MNEQGGLTGMEKLKWQRANMLYDTLDNSKLFQCHAEKGSRSGMNVTFRTGSEELDAKLCPGGHRRRLRQPEGPPEGGRHARLHLQRHARRRRGEAVRLHQGL